MKTKPNSFRTIMISISAINTQSTLAWVDFSLPNYSVHLDNIQVQVVYTEQTVSPSTGECVHSLPEWLLTGNTNTTWLSILSYFHKHLVQVINACGIFYINENTKYRYVTSVRGKSYHHHVIVAVSCCIRC